VLYSGLKARATPERGRAPTFFVDGAENEMELESQIGPVVEASGLELVEVSFHRGQGRGLLRVTVDREGGVDLDAIGQASERISRRLDLEGFDPGPYTLEVTSPGVERPLTRPRDWARRVGSVVKVKTASPVEGSRSMTGTIVEAGPDEVRIATEEGERTVRFEDVTAARTVFEWGPQPKAKGGRR
jgi:ribosome maturation factor RimP